MANVPVTARALAELIGLDSSRGVISSTVAKDVFDKMWTSGRRCRRDRRREGLAQIGDEAHAPALVARGASPTIPTRWLSTAPGAPTPSGSWSAR